VSAQLGLTLQHAPDYARDAFVISPSNAVAASILDGWPDWRGGALALVGPPGSGKTHLAEIWARRLSAARWPQAAGPEGTAHPILLEGADSLLEDGDHAEEVLFHLLNRAAGPGGGLLLTARTQPCLWEARLPDLRSRLNALPIAEIEEPDDVVLGAMLQKFFRERSILPSEELLAYLLRRIERSAQSAHDVVARLDEAAHAAGRGVSRSLARLVLGEESSEVRAEASV
jgi:chromosomal replication initiation ATPase DnaA